MCWAGGKGLGPEEDVGCLDVAMQDFPVVDMLYGATELNKPLPDGFLSK